VDWERGRFLVHSPKTEHLEAGGDRWVPIFPELRLYLADAFDAAEPGAVYVIARCRDAAKNLRTQMQRIIRRAGVTPWPKPFQNFRASRETEPAAKYPLHVVCAWIGNTADVAAKHYLPVTHADYERATVAASEGGAKSGAVAVQEAVQSVHDGDRQQPPKTIKALENKGFEQVLSTVVNYLQSCPMPPEGLEPSTR
jgi:hypothetical protein